MQDVDAYRIGWLWPKCHGWRLRLAHFHRPWQAEAEGMRWARRGWTKQHALRRLLRDIKRAPGLPWDGGKDRVPMAYVERALMRLFDRRAVYTETEKT